MSALNVYLIAVFPLASFPSPIYERRGPGTHCLCMHWVSMVIHYDNVYGTPHFSGGYHGDPAHVQAVCTRPGNEAIFSYDIWIL